MAPRDFTGIAIMFVLYREFSTILEQQTQKHMRSQHQPSGLHCL